MNSDIPRYVYELFNTDSDVVSMMLINQLVGITSNNQCMT